MKQCLYCELEFTFIEYLLNTLKNFSEKNQIISINVFRNKSNFLQANITYIEK